MMTQAEGRQMIAMARAHLAKVIQSRRLTVSDEDLDDLVSDVLLDVIERHRNPGMPSWQWLRYRVIDALARRSAADGGIPTDPSTLDQ